MSTNFYPGNFGDARPPLAPAGELRRHAGFRSRHLEAERDVLVFLPPGYDAEGQRRYPVLYLHDGQNLFDGSSYAFSSPAIKRAPSSSPRVSFSLS